MTTAACKGLRVLEEPQDRAWVYEIKFADPDGNVLRLGTETRRAPPAMSQE